MLPRLPHADGIELRYEWIKNWDVLEGLDFQDGSEIITILRPVTDDDPLYEVWQYSN